MKGAVGTLGSTVKIGGEIYRLGRMVCGAVGDVLVSLVWTEVKSCG